MSKSKVVSLEEKKKEMKFTAQQRLVLIGMLPKEGSYFNIKKVREVREDLGFNDFEQKTFEGSTLLIPGGTVTDWKSINAKVPLKVVDVGEWLSRHFKTNLKQQYDQEKLREETIDLYDFFCGNPSKK